MYSFIKFICCGNMFSNNRLFVPYGVVLMDKEQYTIEYDLLTEWYNSEVAKLDYALAQMRIELMKKYKDTVK